MICDDFWTFWVIVAFWFVKKIVLVVAIRWIRVEILKLLFSHIEFLLFCFLDAGNIQLKHCNWWIRDDIDQNYMVQVEILLSDKLKYLRI